MKPHKFLQSYRCNCFQPKNYCNCTRRVTASKILIENLNDIAESLVEVMSLCGIEIVNSKAITDVILYYFLHFEEIIQRIDSVPRKRLNKEDLFYDLARKCSMKRMEAQMTYSIIKRAFKAFYYGTGLGGVPYITLNNKLTHSSECLWVHAAQRTAQIYASYEGVFYPFQKNLECKIKLIYKHLCKRISNRHQPDDDHECICSKCMKRIASENLKNVRVTTEMHTVQDPYEAAYLKEQEREMEKQAHENRPDARECVSESRNENENKTVSCTCLSLNVTEKDYIYRENAESTQTGSSQGPFDCHWISLSEKEMADSQVDIERSIKLPDEFSCYLWHSHVNCYTECDCKRESCSCRSDNETECEDEGERKPEEIIAHSNISENIE